MPTNGANQGGNTPASPDPLPASCLTRVDSATNGPYTGPQVPGLSNVAQMQNDFLFRVVQNGYYGHPNPQRCEWVLNGGNPTAGTDTAEVTAYPTGTQPDRNWRGAAFDFGLHRSPDGVIEYRSDIVRRRPPGQAPGCALQPGRRHHRPDSRRPQHGHRWLRDGHRRLHRRSRTRSTSLRTVPPATSMSPSIGAQKITLLRPARRLRASCCRHADTRTPGTCLHAVQLRERRPRPAAGAPLVRTAGRELRPAHDRQPGRKRKCGEVIRVREAQGRSAKFPSTPTMVTRPTCVSRPPWQT